MKLSKIYANYTRFKPILFNSGFNVIYGDVEKEKDINEKTGEHNIGKTSLVHLIDFLLLKGVSKGGFFQKNRESLGDWIFFLEIELNSGKYLTIKRSVNPNSKISFKEHFSKNQDYREETKWDYEDLSLNSASDEENPKVILQNKYLNFDVINDFPYRGFLSFLLRTQNDYQDVFKLNKFVGKDSTWKPLLYRLIGFDPKKLAKKYDLDAEISYETKILSDLIVKQDSDSENAIKLAIEAKEKEKSEIQSRINEFDFYNKEQNINIELVKGVEAKISELNKQEYLHKYNSEKIRASLDSDGQQTIQIEEIKQLYKEIEVYFPDNLVKDYDDVIKFSTQITKERKKYLKKELSEINKQLKDIEIELKLLNSRRKELLSSLKEKDTFVKYQKYQSDISSIDNEILFFKQKLEGSTIIKTYQESIDKKKEEIKNIANKIKSEIASDNKDYQSIRGLFQDIYKKTFDYTALLIVEPNRNANVEFTTTVLNKSQDLTGQGDGYTSTKVLCASFVLAVLLHYSSRSFFRFAYHDGIVESWGDNHKVRFINLVRSLCDEYGLQYTISLIKSDVPDNFSFNDGEVVKTLCKGDELFGFEF